MLVYKIFLIFIILKESKGAALTPNPSIIIVGSGPSGIAAATKLLKNNFTNIKLLEAENRIGGRINSVNFGDAYVDLGAEFCHGEKDNIVYSMTKDLGILKSSDRRADFLLSSGEFINERTGDKIFELAESLEATDETIENCENVLSVGECLTIKSKNLTNSAEDPKEKEILTQSIDWIKSYLRTLDCTFDLNDLKITTAYKKCEGDLALNWNGLGYKTILEIMMQKYPFPDKELPIEDKIFLQKEVSNISNWREGQKVIVTTADGGTYEADHIIFTPSVGVLKAIYHTLFNPKLPQEKVNAITNIGFGAIMKVIMHFPQRWWKDDISWPLIWTGADKEEMMQKKLEWLISVSDLLQAENNPNVIISWYSGRYIPFMETLSDEEILEGQKFILNKFVGPIFNVTMPDKIIRSYWYSNPHFKGTYSFESVKGHSSGGSKFPDKLAKPLLNQHHVPTVLFAGEATHPYYFSTVHGAIESGYREAKRIINFYRKHSIHILDNLF